MWTRGSYCWPAPSLGPFFDKKSGFYHVERPALREVEQLITQRAVDVVVVLNFERLARNLERRYASLYHARKYGVEYRFAELEPDSKLADDLTSRLIVPVLEAYGEINREKIVENTMRGRAKRVALGFPTGGRGGPPYGFRKVAEGDATTYWAERTDEADILRAMFTWLVEMDATKSANASARALCRDLNRRGIRTRAAYKWSSQTVIEKLRNPLYCGRGQLNRWQITHETKTNTETGENYDARVVQPRTETFSIAEGMIPTLIDPDLFDKVQAILDAPNLSAGRLGRKNSNHPHDATLLHSDFIKCAHCGRAMVRYWRPPSPKHPQGVPYYRCGTMGGSPDHCVRHSIRAAIVEDFALRGLARVLTDPKKIVALADAADQSRADADYRLIKTTNDLEAMEALLAEIDADITNTQDGIDALRKVAGMEATIRDLQGKLIALSENRARAIAEHARLAPQRDHAAKRSEQLRALFSARDLFSLRGIVNRITGEANDDNTAQSELPEWMPVHIAARVLGFGDDIDKVDRNDDNALLQVHSGGWLEQRLGEAVPPNWPGGPFRRAFIDYTDEHGIEVSDYIYDEVQTEYVIHSLLRRTPHDSLRRLLRELNVVIRVSPPRSPQERATSGNTPPEERIAVQIGTLVVQGWALVKATAGDTGSASVANGTKLAMPTMSTPAAQRSG